VFIERAFILLCKSAFASPWAEALRLSPSFGDSDNAPPQHSLLPDSGETPHFPRLAPFGFPVPPVVSPLGSPFLLSPESFEPASPLLAGACGVVGLLTIGGTTGPNGTSVLRCAFAPSTGLNTKAATTSSLTHMLALIVLVLIANHPRGLMFLDKDCVPMRGTLKAYGSWTAN
jgi:hypothetical protein